MITYSIIKKKYENIHQHIMHLSYDDLEKLNDEIRSDIFYIEKMGYDICEYEYEYLMEDLFKYERMIDERKEQIEYHEYIGGEYDGNKKYIDEGKELNEIKFEDIKLMKFQEMKRHYNNLKRILNFLECYSNGAMKLRNKDYPPPKLEKLIKDLQEKKKFTLMTIWLVV